MRWISVILLIILPSLALAQDPADGITVSATGTAKATPDMATVTLGVAREGRSASQAMEAMASAAEAVLSDIEATGVEARDIQTSSLNLNPVWEQGNSRPPQVRGYVASTMLTVRVRDLDQLGALLDSAVGEGANALNGLFFGVADTSPLETSARADAVRKARAKAETLAEAAGVTLGPVQSILEGPAQGGPAPMMRGAVMEAAAVPVAAGELDIRVAVTVVFEIAE